MELEKVKLQNQQILNDKKQLQQTVHQLEQMLNEMTQKNENLEIEVSWKESTITKLNTMTAAQQDIKAQRDQFKQLYETEQHARALLSE
jgi:uncharacterized coiled-coil protein SlyX